MFSRATADWKKAKVRGYPYNIFFRVEAGQVVVVAVFHQKRNPETLKRRASEVNGY